MKEKRYTSEQKIRILRENVRLKRMLADEMPGKELLKEALEKML